MLMHQTRLAGLIPTNTLKLWLFIITTWPALMHKTRSAVYHYNTYHLGLEKLQLEFSQAHDSNIITLQNPLKTNLRFNSHLNTQAGRTSQECLHLFMSLEPRRYCDVTLMTGLLCWVVQYSWFWWSLSKDYVYDVSPPRGVGGVSDQILCVKPPNHTFHVC